jgi:hypothetical protein
MLLHTWHHIYFHYDKTIDYMLANFIVSIGQQEFERPVSANDFLLLKGSDFKFTTFLVAEEQTTISDNPICAIMTLEFIFLSQ